MAEKKATEKTAKAEKPVKATKTAKKADSAKDTEKKKTTTKKSAKKQEQMLTYNGKPLLRCGNEIYYGNPDDKYIVVFRLEDREPLEDLEIAKRVVIELKTNEGKRSQLIRQAERDGLYKAFDIGMFWLEQALENG